MPDLARVLRHMRVLLPILLLAASTAFAADALLPDESDVRLHPDPACAERDADPADCIIQNGPPPRPRIRNQADLPPPILVPEPETPQPPGRSLSESRDNRVGQPLGRAGAGNQQGQLNGAGSPGTAGLAGGGTTLGGGTGAAGAAGNGSALGGGAGAAGSAGRGASLGGR